MEIPWIVRLDQTFKKKRVAVVGISLDISYEYLKTAGEAWARVKPFVETHQVTYPILMSDGDVSKRYGIEALPATYLIDVRGRIAALYVGLIDEQNVEANIKTLLAEDQLVGQSSHWHFEKVDRANGNRLIQVDAKSFDQTGDGRIKYLHDMTARLYRANGDFKQISSKEAVADMNRATLAYGADLKTVISLKNP